MDLTFYDRNGNAFCYTDDGVHIYLFSGQALAYLHDDALYSFGGHQLGWFLNGWLYDLIGSCVLFSEETTDWPGKPGVAGKPGKAGKAGLPGKAGREGMHGRPGPGGWSLKTPEELFQIQQV